LIGVIVDQKIIDHRGQINRTASENESYWTMCPGFTLSEIIVILPVLLVAGIKIDIGPTVEL
jgi:hypothetical protein